MNLTDKEQKQSNELKQKVLNLFNTFSDWEMYKLSNSSFHQELLTLLKKYI